MDISPCRTPQPAIGKMPPPLLDPEIGSAGGTSRTDRQACALARGPRLARRPAIVQMRPRRRRAAAAAHAPLRTSCPPRRSHVRELRPQGGRCRLHARALLSASACRPPACVGIPADERHAKRGNINQTAGVVALPAIVFPALFVAQYSVFTVHILVNRVTGFTVEAGKHLELWYCTRCMGEIIVPDWEKRQNDRD